MREAPASAASARRANKKRRIVVGFVFGRAAITHVSYRDIEGVKR
jgi:hypothetical protein